MSPSARAVSTHPRPPSPHKSSPTFNGFDCRKRTVLSGAYYYPRASYWDASIHLDSCSLFLPVVRQTLPNCDAISDNQPGAQFPSRWISMPHTPGFLFSPPSRTNHPLGARASSLQQCGPPQAAKETSCMQSQLSSLQICDLIPPSSSSSPPTESFASDTHLG